MRAAINVLVVDDSPTNRVMMARGIARRGFNVTQACDGGEALEKFVAALQGGFPFTLIVSDLTMPRMNGAELATSVQSVWSDYKLANESQEQPFDDPVFIGVTGNAMEGDVDSFLAAGAHVVLLKPASVSKVLQTANQIMGNRWEGSSKAGSTGSDRK